MRSFDYVAPATIKAAVDALASSRRSTVLAGGTDLLIGMKFADAAPRLVVDVKRLPGAGDLAVDRKRGVTIGPAVTMRQAERSDALWTDWTAIAEGAALVGSVQIRNRATAWLTADSLITVSPHTVSMSSSRVTSRSRWEMR